MFALKQSLKFQAKRGKKAIHRELIYLQCLLQIYQELISLWDRAKLVPGLRTQ